MNKFYLLLIIIIYSVNYTNAQNVATLNPGFENWTLMNNNHYDPDNWNTLNPNTYILGVFTCTRATGAYAHSGNYALKLTTKSVFMVTANGIASTATLITTPPYGVTGGIPYTGRPDSIVGWYQYVPASAADSGFMEIVLFGANGDTVGFSRFTTPNSSVASYTRFSRPVTYYSAATPANSYWILTSSDGVNPVVNSSLWIDDIDFVFNSTGINGISTVNDLSVVNNFVEDNLKVNNNSPYDAELCITDEAGRTVQHFDVVKGENNFNVQQLRSGIYFFQLYNNRHTDVTNGKLVKL